MITERRPGSFLASNRRPHWPPSYWPGAPAWPCRAAARWEPKRLRLRLLAVAGRLVRTAQRTLLKISEDWPWAPELTTAHARLAAFPP